MTALIGQTLLRQFRVEAFLGSGGMGVVYRVWDIKRDVPVAMKVLHVDLAEDPSILKRFKREARALQKLAHPNIVPFYGLHQAGDITFLLERYIDGPSMKDILRQRKKKPMPVNDALIYLKSLSSALGYANAHDVVHCDVKPGNVMVDQGGSVYLTDFGVARHADSTTTTLGFAGTAAYMAPEQCRGDPVTAETDVYALGVMLFEMLTGQRPFRGDERDTESAGQTAAERVRYAHVNVQPPDPRDIVPRISESLARGVLKALAKEPEHRYRTTRNFFEAICQAAGTTPDQVADRAQVPTRLVKRFTTSARSMASPVGRAPAAEADSLQQALPWLPRRMKPAVLMGVGVLALGGLAVVLGRGGSSANPGQDGTSQDRNLVVSATGNTEPSTLVQESTRSEPTADRPATSAAQTVEARQTELVQATPTPIPGSLWRPFSNCPQSRIRVGDWTRVTLIPPLPNRVRHEPGYDTGIVLGKAQPGELLEILEGPVCRNQILWWRVRTERGLEGWTGEGTSDEFWLDPGDPFGPGLQDGGF